jgi:hypothetical protein
MAEEITRTVRVIRTWDLKVPAVYGDTDETLKAKISEEQLDSATPDAEQRILMPVKAKGEKA